MYQDVNKVLMIEILKNRILLILSILAKTQEKYPDTTCTGIYITTIQNNRKGCENPY
jgi:hypothetical protein